MDSGDQTYRLEMAGAVTSNTTLPSNTVLASCTVLGANWPSNETGRAEVITAEQASLTQFCNGLGKRERKVWREKSAEVNSLSGHLWGCCMGFCLDHCTSL